MPQRERRQATRHPLMVTIEVSIDHDLLFQATGDLSQTGAFLEHAIPYPVGTGARLKILLPDGKAPIVCEAEVVNIPDAAEVGMGLKFLDISIEDRERIEAIGASQGPAGKKDLP